jgi:glycosyltransferase involved in cell wall biosynthesis
MPTPAYVIITPARNEGERIQKTIDSVAKQTIRPMRWVLVDDGSADKTGPLIDAAAKEHSWISAIHRPDRGFRKQGGGVIEAFYDGLKLVEEESWDFLGKLDGDLAFPADYFENCLSRFAADSRLGIGGGIICQGFNGAMVESASGDPPFHVRGATKIYRRATWQAIGGLIKAPGWDTLDEVKANMLGWRTYSFKELLVLQLKPTGSADGSWRNWVKNGRANYVVGYHPLFMLLKCLKRLRHKPYGITALGLLVGFVSGYLKRIPQVNDKPLIEYLRDQQWRRLTGRPSLWSGDTQP